MGLGSWYLLSKLRRAVKKVKFLLNFGIHRWQISSPFAVSQTKRALSFGDRPGLRAFADDATDLSRGCSGSFGGSLQRTMSYPSEDDVDKRAEMFIANFHRQLQIERQVSLELGHRENSLDSATSF